MGCVLLLSSIYQVTEFWTSGYDLQYIHNCAQLYVQKQGKDGRGCVPAYMCLFI